MARISTFRNVEPDWRGRPARQVRRWIRAGAWTSSSGTAKTSLSARARSRRPIAVAIEQGRRPMTWSARSIAASSGSRWAAVHGDRASVTISRGASVPAIVASSRPPRWPNRQARTIASADRPRAVSRASRPSATRSAAPAWASSSSTTTNTAAPGRGDRRRAASNGSRSRSSSAWASIRRTRAWRPGTARRPRGRPSRARLQLARGGRRRSAGRRA